MLQLGKVSLVIVGSLLLSLIVLVSGVSAQQTGRGNTNLPARTTIASRVLLEANRTMPDTAAQPTSDQPANFICIGDCLAQRNCTSGDCEQGHSSDSGDSGNCSQERYCIFGSCAEEHNCIFGDCSRYRHCDDWWCSRW